MIGDKFRAWDLSIDKMIYPEGATIYEIIEASEECEDECWLLNTKHVLMNNIGKKDKNEKEIFEKDILRVEYEDLLGIMRKVIGIVEIGEFEVMLDFPHYGVEVPLSSFTNENYDGFEIMGNAYENPELIVDQGLLF